MNFAKRFRRSRRTWGVTLVEVVAACSLMAMIFLATAFMMSGTAKQVRALYSDCRTLNRAHLVMQFIHYRLSMAMAGTTVSTTDEGRTLLFYNPMITSTPGTPVSAFRFLPEKQRVYYDMDKDNPVTDPGRGIGLVNDVKFEILGPGRAVRVTVITRQDYAWRLPKPYVLTAEISLRN